MSNLQAFLLGIMVILTPSMLYIAFEIWRAKDDDETKD